MLETTWGLLSVVDQLISTSDECVIAAANITDDTHELLQQTPGEGGDSHPALLLLPATTNASF